MKDLAYQEENEPSEKGIILHLKNGTRINVFYVTEHRSYQIYKDVDYNYWAYDPTPEIRKVCEPSCKTFEEVQELIDDAIVLEFAESCFESEYGDPEKYREESEQLFQDQEESDLNDDAYDDLINELGHSDDGLFGSDPHEPYSTEEEAYWALTGKK